MKDYSVAIRTVGKAGEKFVQEIRSLENQSIKPNHIYVLLAEGFEQPAQIGSEEYRIVPKGLVHQRALSSDYVQEEYLLILDDDVYLPPTAVESMLEAMDRLQADCIIPDTFPTHHSSWKGKLIAYLSNHVSGRRNDQWGIRIKKSGAFSYNNSPERGSFYRTESGAGPAFMVKSDAFRSIRYADEYWIDQFPPGTFYEDQLMYYKMHVNGVRMYIWYDSGITHLDAGTNNQKEKNAEKLMYRAMANYVIWHRSVLETMGASHTAYCLCSLSYFYRFLLAWITRFFFSLIKMQLRFFCSYFKGNIKGLRFVLSEEYKSLPSFLIEK